MPVAGWFVPDPVGAAFCGGEFAVVGEGACVAAGCADARTGAPSCLESSEPAKNKKAFHSVLAPSENFVGPCPKSTTNPKVKTASNASLKTKIRSNLMAKSRD